MHFSFFCTILLYSSLVVAQQIAFEVDTSFCLSNSSYGYSYLSTFQNDVTSNVELVSVLDSIDVVSLTEEPVVTGSFLFKQNLETSGIEVVDVNNDHLMDLVVGSYWSNRFTIYLGDGEGNFSEFGHYSLDGHCNGISIGDIDNDGFPDVAAIRNGSTQPIAVHIFLNNGDGTFVRSYFHEVGDHTNSEQHILDLNNDGKRDLFIRSGNGFVVTYMQVTPEEFVPHYVPIMPLFPGTNFTVPGGRSIANADFDGDQILDMCITYQDSLLIRTGNGDGTYNEYPILKYYSDNLGDVIAKDLDNNGQIEIIAKEFRFYVDRIVSDSIFVFTYDENIGLRKVHALKSPFELRNGPGSTILTDFTGDRFLDLVIQGYENRLLFLRGVGSLPPLEIPKPTHLSMYPNPLEDHIWIDLMNHPGKEMEISIYGVSGALLLSQVLLLENQPVRVDLPRLSEKMIILKLQIGKRTLSRKLLIDGSK